MSQKKRGTLLSERVPTPPSKEKGLMCQFLCEWFPRKERGIDFGFTTEISSATRDQTKHSQPYLSFGSNSLF